MDGFRDKERNQIKRETQRERRSRAAPVDSGVLSVSVHSGGPFKQRSRQ